MRSRVVRSGLLLAVLSATAWADPAPEANVCPQAAPSSRSGTLNTAYEGAVAASGTCNQAFVFNADGTVRIVAGNPYPFAGSKGTLIGVVNNTAAVLTHFQVTAPGASPAIFALDNNGICAYTPFPSNSQPCYPDSAGASNYAGSAISYTGVNAALDTGTINFSPGIPAGGTGYFSLAGPATVSVVAAASLSQSFSPGSINSGGTSTLTFTIANPNAVALSLIGFNDNLTAGIRFAVAPNTISVCGGSVSWTAQQLTFSGGALPAGTPPINATCSFSLPVSGDAAGTYNSVSSGISSTGPAGMPGQPGAASSATLTVLAAMPPVLSMSFSPGKTGVGGTVSLTFTIANPNAVAALTGIGFTDPLPVILAVAQPAGVVNSCGGTLGAVPGSSAITLTGASLAAGASCFITVSVTAGASGVAANVTDPVTSNAGAGNAAQASLTVALPPALSAMFSAASIPPQASAVLTFVLSNPDPGVAITGISFSDSLPPGLAVSSPNGLGGTCVPAATAPPGSRLISVSGVALAPGASCSITVSVTADGTATGAIANTTGPVTANETLSGTTATAGLFLGDTFQVSSFANLNIGDSSVEVSNAASMPVTNQTGITASVTGALCANVYAFSPDEQIVSCCSCPVTPNGLVGYSVRDDIIANRLIGAVPGAVVIKLLATAPVGGTCVNSAASDVPLATGMVAWGTKLHLGVGTISANNPSPRYSVTETPFTSSTLTAGELNRVRASCSFVLSEGSGSGVCSACRNNGLGAVKQ